MLQGLCYESSKFTLICQGSWCQPHPAAAALLCKPWGIHRGPEEIWHWIWMEAGLERGKNWSKDLFHDPPRKLSVIPSASAPSCQQQ